MILHSKEVEQNKTNIGFHPDIHNTNNIVRMVLSIQYLYI